MHQDVLVWIIHFKRTQNKYSFYYVFYANQSEPFYSTWLNDSESLIFCLKKSLLFFFLRIATIRFLLKLIIFRVILWQYPKSEWSWNKKAYHFWPIWPVWFMPKSWLFLCLFRHNPQRYCFDLATELRSHLRDILTTAVLPSQQLAVSYCEQSEKGEAA